MPDGRPILEHLPRARKFSGNILTKNQALQFATTLNVFAYMLIYSDSEGECLDGAGEEIRTPDPIITNDVLYQLSYTGASIEVGAF